MNTLYWNFNGLDQASHYSTSMVSKKAYRNGIFGSLVMVSCAYLLPILIATGATNLEQDEWKEGTFAVAATELAAPWLGNWIVVSAGISLLAQFFSEMSADSMQLQGMAERGHLPSLFGHRSRHDTPSVRHFLTVFVCLFLDFQLLIYTSCCVHSQYSLLLGLVVILLLIPFPFGFIIELSNFAFCMTLMVEFMAFAQIMIRKGDSSKLRKALYSIMLIIPMMLNIFVLLLASYATYIYGACLVVFGIILINAKRINLACCSSCGRGCTECDNSCSDASCCLC